MNKQKERQNYSYTIEVPSIAAGAQASASVNIDTDASFFWLKTSYVVFEGTQGDSESSRVIPMLTMQLNDTGSGRNFFDKEIPISCVCGTGEIPFILPLAQIFKPNATIKATFRNLSPTVDYQNLFIVMTGYKEFGSRRG